MPIKDPPPFDSVNKNYTRYKTEVEAWTEVTSHPKSKWGQIIALSLPENDPSGIRDKVFESIDASQLKGEDGYKNLIKFLDDEFEEHKLHDIHNKIRDFTKNKKKSDQTFQQYISSFDNSYRQAKKAGLTEMPQAYLMFQLLENSGLNEQDQRLCQTDISFSDTGKLYENTKKAIIKYFGNKNSSTNTSKSDNRFDLIDEKEALFGDFRNRSSSFPTRGRQFFNRGAGNSSNNLRGNSRFQTPGSSFYRPNSAPFRQPFNRNSQPIQGGPRQNLWQGGNYIQRQSAPKPINPVDKNGSRMICSSCGSYRHLLNSCPYSWEALNNQGTFIANYHEPEEEEIVQHDENLEYYEGIEDENEYATMFVYDNSEIISCDVLYTGKSPAEISRLVLETLNKLLVDTGCNSTVGGRTEMVQGAFGYPDRRSLQ